MPTRSVKALKKLRYKKVICVPHFPYPLTDTFEGKDVAAFKMYMVLQCQYLEKLTAGTALDYCTEYIVYIVCLTSLRPMSHLHFYCAILSCNFVM